MGMISSPLVGLKQMWTGGKKSKVYDELSEKAKANQNKLSKQLSEWGEQDWDEWTKTFAPAEEATVARATDGFKAQTDRATGAATVGNARGMSGANKSLNAALLKRGVNPASGTAIAARAGLSNAGAAKSGADISMARTDEENRVNDMNWNNRLNLVATGSKGMADQALMLTKASDVNATGMRRAAGLSDMYSNAAMSGLAGVGEGIGRAAGAYGRYDQNNRREAGGDWDFGNTDQHGNTYGNNTDDDFFDNQEGLFADGGLVVGPGTGTSDSIPATIDGEAPAAVSNGEYRIPAAVVARVGLKKLEAIVAKYHRTAPRS